MLLVMCAYINLLNHGFATVGEVLNYVFGVGSLLLVFAMPVYLFVKLRREFDTLGLDSVRERYGAFYEDMELRRGKTILYQPMSFFARRAILGSIVVFQSILIVQTFAIIMLTVFQIILLGYVRPFILQSRQKMEMMNEIAIMFIFYTFISLSDLVPEVETRYTVGFASCAAVAIHLLVNVSIIVVQSIKDALRKCRLVKAKVNYNKVKAQMEAARKANQSIPTRQRLRLSSHKQFNLSEVEEEEESHPSSGEIAQIQQQNRAHLRSNRAHLRKLGHRPRDQLSNQI